MNTAKKVAAVVFSLSAAAAAAQITPSHDHPGHHAGSGTAASADAGKAEGEVRKVDKENKKLTLRHGPILNLEMPEMTMVFRVADPSLLDGLVAKQKIRFSAARVDGQLTVTSLKIIP